MHLPTWKNPKHAQQWINTLKQYVFPRIGSKKISTISSADILTVLTPIWTSKPETASRVRQRMGAVLKWSIAQGWRVDNPAEAISQALPKRDKTANNHHTSLPYEQVSNAIQTIQDSSAGIATKLSFEFLILTAARSGEVRGASWDEISGNTWTIPKSRMKAKRSHRVPLSERCMEILAEAESLKDSSGFIFSARPKTDEIGRDFRRG